MNAVQIIHLLEEAARAGRYRAMSLYADMIVSLDPANMDAIGLNLKGIIKTGLRETAATLFDALGSKVVENGHIATAYFDFLALEERYEELFYHVWQCLNREDMSDACSYMEKAVSAIDSLLSTKIIEAKASLSCQLEIELFDRVRLSFLGHPNPPMLQIKETEDQGEIILEISALTRHISSGAHPTGIQRCLCEVINELAQSEVRASVLFFQPMQNGAVSMSVADFLKILNNQDGVKLIRNILFADPFTCQQYGVGLAKIGAEDVFILTDVFWAIPDRQVAFLEECHCIKLLLIHDLIPMVLNHEPAPEVAFSESLRAIAKRVDGFLGNSDFTTLQAQKYLDFEGIMRKNCKTVRLAAAIPTKFEVFATPRIKSLRTNLLVGELVKGKFILTVSSLSERKRIVELAEAFLDASSDVVAEWRLVIVGGDSLMNPYLTEKLQNLCTTSHGRIVWLKGISDVELESLYLACKFTAYPSSYEGWGLPVGESLAYGKVVVAHAIASIPEVGADQVNYCALDHINLTASLRRLIVDEGFLKASTDKISIKDLRSWRQVAEEFSASKLKANCHIPEGDLLVS
jgi:glycosyltransferase involved in cell wall biosynthesis